MELYQFISENQVAKYDGSILKKVEENKLVKVVANPSEADLREFGYKELIETPMPEEREGYYWSRKYIDGDTITTEWEENEIPPEEEEPDINH